MNDSLFWSFMAVGSVAGLVASFMKDKGFKDTLRDVLNDTEENFPWILWIVGIALAMWLFLYSYKQMEGHKAFQIAIAVALLAVCLYYLYKHYQDLVKPILPWIGITVGAVWLIFIFYSGWRVAASIVVLAITGAVLSWLLATRRD